MIHKTTDGMDTRLATMHHPMVTNPLEHTLGPHQFGTFRQAPSNRPYAFERIEDLWGEDMPNESDSDEDSEDDDEEIDDAEEDGDREETSDTGADNTAAETDNMEIDETEIGNNSNAERSTRARRKNANDGETPDSNDVPNLRRSKRARNLPELYRDRNIQHNVVQQLPSRQQRIHALKQAIRESRDKLVVIQYQPVGKASPTWFVAQVQWRESEEQADIDKGFYQLQFLIRHAIDSQRKTTRSCRYWPEIHRRRPDGTMGDIIMVKPNKADKMTQQARKYIARRVELNLDKHLIVGPFNYAIPKEYDNQANRIPDEVWIELIHGAPRRGVPTEDLNQVIPLTAI